MNFIHFFIAPSTKTIYRCPKHTLFYIHVLEMTTKEIIDNQTLLPITQNYFSKVISILKNADKIKYAKLEELCGVDLINEEFAHDIFMYFNN